MQMQIIWAAAVFFGGWLWAYLFIRQLLFNLMTAYPLIRKMRAARADLIAVGADRYTTISMIVCCFFLLLIAGLVVRFCKLYMIIAFFVGGLSATLMLLGKLSPENRAMFDAFCTTYYRFVPDDELRTAMFNKKPGQIKQRLYNMDLARDMVPEFKDDPGK